MQKPLIALSLAIGMVTTIAQPALAASPYPPVIGADYVGPHSLRQLNSPGIGGSYVGWVFRYVGTRGSWKNLSVSEREQLVHNGWWKGVGFVSEGTGREVTGGYSAGRAQALRVLADPAYVRGYPVVFAVDFDWSGNPSAYLNGAASVLGSKSLVGVYGSVRVVKKACAAGFRHTNWAAYAWRFGQTWPDGNCAPIRQVANGRLWGGSGDIDLQVGPYRFYGPGSHPPVPASKPAPHVTPSPKPIHRAVTATVTVHRGDTLTRIARAHHTTWQHLAAVNHLRNPSRIFPGQHIHL